MPVCDCGAITGRYIVHLETPDGKPLDESYTSCPSCRPAEFPADKPWNPLDRVVTGPEAMPQRYKLGTDGRYHPTDELRQDTEDLIMSEGPTAERERIKRETRRTAPMSESEIKEAELIWRNRQQSTLIH